MSTKDDTIQIKTLDFPPVYSGVDQEAEKLVELTKEIVPF